MSPFNYRYPGARPFTPEESPLFFGRQEDVEALAQLIRLEQVVVLFSKSGMGKSSLVNAGLLPRLKEERGFEPFLIRLRSYTVQESPSPVDTVRHSIEPEEKSILLEKISPAGQSLWHALKNRQLSLQKPGTAVLAFDQFEEFFTYPQEQKETFARQMAELLFTQIPQRARQQIEKQMETLSDEELDRLHEPIAAKAVFIIRSDSLALLEQLGNYLPNILRHNYELRALNRQQAVEAIVQPATLNGGFRSPPFEYTSRAVEAIFDFLSVEGIEEVESFQLQIMGSYLEQKVISQGLGVIDITDIGNPAKAIENFYEDRIAALDSPEKQLAARRLIEEGLIFEEDERRLSLYEGQIRQVYNVSSELLQELMSTHLLRAEPSIKGGYTYELAHDTLISPVLRAKRMRTIQLETQERNAQRVLLEKQAEAELLERTAEMATIEGLKRQNRYLRLGIVLLIAIITILVLLLARA